jgi:hypothetical protein
MIINTKTVENFLSEAEIAEIEDMNNKGMSTLVIDNYNPSESASIGLDRIANYWNFSIYEESNRRLKEIILPKLQYHFHNDVYIDNCHILESFYPYKIHTDATDIQDNDYTIKPQGGMTAAWTFIIPLDNYNSNTIIFNQEALEIKDAPTWIKNTQPPVLNSIDEETYNRYLKNVVTPHELQYLSIDEIFPWKKGNLSATSRAKFHTSDWFYNNGVTQKRALVMWTTIPQGLVDGRPLGK